MSRKERDSKGRRNTSVPLSIAGMTLLATVGAAAAAQAPAANGPQREIAPAVSLSEEEILDVSTASFYVFDRENLGALRQESGPRFAATKPKSNPQKPGSSRRGAQSPPWSMKR